MHYPIRVLFLCTGNSARSQMAEALLRIFGGKDFEVFSAGSDPQPLHPMSIDVMQEVDIDISKQRSKHLNEYLNQDFDYIITVCDRVKDHCPTFPGDNVRIHWNFNDPAAVTGSQQEQHRAFQRVRNEISERLRIWVMVQRKLLHDQDLLPEENALNRTG